MSKDNKWINYHEWILYKRINDPSRKVKIIYKNNEGEIEYEEIIY